MGRRFVMLLAVAFTLLSACDRPSPETLRKRMHLPAADFRPNAELGSQLFEGNCIECHGMGARGSDKGPSLMDNVYHATQHADLSFHFAIRDGVRQHHWQFGDMPPQPHMTPEQVGHIIAYIRAEQHQIDSR